MNRNLENRMNADESITERRFSTLTEVYNYFKIIILGNVSVGKTSILRQLMEESFDDRYSCTLSADFKVKSILVDNNTWVEMNIWDTCGQEKYRTITRQYYKDAKVYDVTHRTSFEDVVTWIEDIREFGDEDVTIIVVGNKADLDKQRVVSFKEGKEFAQKFNFDYIEVSAKTGMNVNILFEILCQSMIKKTEYLESKRPKKKSDRPSTIYYLDKSASRFSELNVEDKKKKKKKDDKCC